MSPAGIVAADLAGGVAQEAVVAHPVGQVVGQPRAALRAVIVGAGRADFEGELLFPVHALGAVRNAEAIRDAEAGMGVDQLPGELVGADVEAAPALGVADEAGHRHRALEHRRQRLAFGHVLPVARRGAADLLVAIELVGVGELLRRCSAAAARAFTSLYLVPCSRAWSRSVRKHQLSALGDQVAVLVEEVDMVDLLDGAAGEARLVLDDVLQPGLGRDRVVAVDRLVPVSSRRPTTWRGCRAGRRHSRRRCGWWRTGSSAARSRRRIWSSRHTPERTTADCRRRCRARSGGYCRASPRSTTARRSRRS